LEDEAFFGSEDRDAMVSSLEQAAEGLFLLPAAAPSGMKATVSASHDIQLYRAGRHGANSFYGLRNGSLGVRLWVAHVAAGL
jgi:hypothetical protein